MELYLLEVIKDYSRNFETTDIQSDTRWQQNKQRN